MVGEEADNSIFKDPQVILMGSRDGRPLIQRLNEILRHHTVSYPIIALSLRRGPKRKSQRSNSLVLQPFNDLSEAAIEVSQLFLIQVLTYSYHRVSVDIYIYIREDILRMCPQIFDQDLGMLRSN